MMRQYDDIDSFAAVCMSILDDLIRDIESHRETAAAANDIFTVADTTEHWLRSLTRDEPIVPPAIAESQYDSYVALCRDSSSSNSSSSSRNIAVNSGGVSTDEDYTRFMQNDLIFRLCRLNDAQIDAIYEDILYENDANKNLV